MTYLAFYSLQMCDAGGWFHILTGLTFPCALTSAFFFIVLPTTAWVLERERKSDEGVMKS